MLIASGTFTPGAGHDMRGGFTLSQTAEGILFRTTEDFFFDGSPAPGWSLFQELPDDASDPDTQAAAQATHFGDLPPNGPVSGVHEALIASGTDIAGYSTIVLWCFRFPFVLGTAPIRPE